MSKLASNIGINNMNRPKTIKVVIIAVDFIPSFSISSTIANSIIPISAIFCGILEFKNFSLRSVTLISKQKMKPQNKTTTRGIKLKHFSNELLNATM